MEMIGVLCSICRGGELFELLTSGKTQVWTKRRTLHTVLSLTCLSLCHYVSAGGGL